MKYLEQDGKRMGKSNRGQLTEMELDALQEIMNISFGSSVADLAKILDIFINLQVPSLETVKMTDLLSYINREVKEYKNCNIVEQGYYGDFAGMSFLIFPYGMEKELMSFFHPSHTYRYESDQLIQLEKEVLMEIGNILIAACIGNVFELLNTSIAYLPPQSYRGEELGEALTGCRLRDDDTAIALTTKFSFEDRKATGHLFFLNSQEAIPYFKKALARFQE